MLTTWSVQNAKARFSELLDTCIQTTPQIVTKRGQEVAVLVSMEEWQRLQAQAKPSLKQLLLTDEARFEFDEVLAENRKAKLTKHIKRRTIPTFED